MDFKLNPVTKPQSLGPEYNPWFWSPKREGGLYKPSLSFMERIEEISEDLRVTWNPILERWQLWMRSPQSHNKYAPGWKLLFIHNGPSGEYLPLDERFLARLYFIDMKNSSAKEYFNRIQQEMARDKEMQEKQNLQDTIDCAMETFDYSRISNKGKGSKFSEYHA